jgi:hypothetical protein
MTRDELRQQFLSEHYIDDQQAKGAAWLQAAAQRGKTTEVSRYTPPKGAVHVLRGEKRSEVDAYVIQGKLVIVGIIDKVKHTLEV